MRAVVYARYSSENQREASITDQVEVCRRYIERQGWTVAGVYDDAAISGASRMRPGFLRLLADAEARRFDVVVCEAIDRLGRKLADVADLYDRLTFARVEIHAISIGHVTQMHIGIMGTMAQMTLSDMRDKVRRGQLGRARAGCGFRRSRPGIPSVFRAPFQFDAAHRSNLMAPGMVLSRWSV